VPAQPIFLSFRTLLDETNSFERILRAYLGDDAGHILGSLRTTLTHGRTATPGTTVRWAVSERRPLRTIDSHGEYEPKRRGHGRRIYGCANFLWELIRIEDAQYDFQLGNASTVLRLMERLEHNGRNRERRIGGWRFEFGVQTSPGSFFHTSVDGIGVWFPHDIPVPRLHGLPLSPFAAIEFIVGELFQDRWPLNAASTNTAPMHRWRAIQRARLESYFDTMKAVVCERHSTPLLLLKNWKPQNPGLLGA
jgi:hypothetical protein